jgi:hypothetical protein
MARVDKQAIERAAWNGLSKDTENGHVGPDRYEFSVPRDARPSWLDVDGKALLQCLEALGDVGDAVILAKTADGGSFALTLLAGRGKGKRYHPHTVAELELMLGMITSAAVQAKK